MVFSVPLVAASTETEAVRLGHDAMAIGADAIMCQWSPRFVVAATEAGIPSQGHAGLVPRKSTWAGGLRAVGKTLDEAKRVYREIKALESASAYAVEVEVIPAELLVEISKRTRFLTSSIGAGSGGDIQFLFADDILGKTRAHRMRAEASRRSSKLSSAYCDEQCFARGIEKSRGRRRR